MSINEYYIDNIKESQIIIDLALTKSF